MNPTLGTLCDAWALIESPARWTRHAYARDVDNKLVGTRDPEAVTWCAIGAVDATCSVIVVEEDALRRLDDAAKALYESSIADVNDGRQHKDVERLYALATALAAEEMRP